MSSHAIPLSDLRAYKDTRPDPFLEDEALGIFFERKLNMNRVDLENASLCGFWVTNSLYLHKRRCTAVSFSMESLGNSVGLSQISVLCRNGAIMFTVSFQRGLICCPENCPGLSGLQYY